MSYDDNNETHAEDTIDGRDTRRALVRKAAWASAWMAAGPMLGSVAEATADSRRARPGSETGGPTGQFAAFPRIEIRVNAARPLGPLEGWRHTLGYGGVNAEALPKRVQQPIRALKPRLIRIFLQEFFNIYPQHGHFDFRTMDAYMDALEQTGAKIVASICIKPRPLYPRIDQTIWRPSDVAEWQNVLFELVRRYSVQRKLVTHWEIGNETDIGEEGGTPYLIPDPAAYTDFYRMAIQPILKAFPTARVGGPATTWAGGEPLPGFVARCRDQAIPLHFVSWHRYDDDPAVHATGVRQVKQRLAGWQGTRPELMVTEWSKSFDPVSLEDLAFHPARAATVASCILAMMEAGLDWSFYYHLWDQVCHPGDFAPFFSPKGVANMAHHWNETPHRFGLFGVGGEVRPQYFVYQMLGRLGEQHIAAESGDPAVQVLAARTLGRVAVLCIHREQQNVENRIMNLHLSGLPAGSKQLTVYRIDAARRWNPTTLELVPVEQRRVDTGADFSCQVLAPANSVSMVRIDAIAPIESLTQGNGPGIIDKPD